MHHLVKRLICVSFRARLCPASHISFVVSFAYHTYLNGFVRSDNEGLSETNNVFVSFAYYFRLINNHNSFASRA